MTNHPRPLETPALHAAPPPTPMPAAASAPAKQGPNRRVLVIVSLIALLALGAGARMWWRSAFFVETDNAYLSGHVHPVSSRVSGVITRVLVQDNQIVKQGQVLAELDPADQNLKIEQIEAQIASASQQVIQAEAQIAQAQAQSGAATAQVAQSSAQMLRAKQDAARFSQLYTSQMKAVSKAEVDAANAAQAAAIADFAARGDSVTAAKAQIAAATAARDIARSQVKVLQVQLKDAQLQQSYHQILAPVAGRVGKRSLEVGARLQPGQQVAAIVEDDVWVTANFKETQLANLRPGQSVKVEVDALDGRVLTGKIDSFSPASGAQFSLLPADNATGNFTKIVQRVPVKIVFQPADLKALQGRLVPGMSALVEIDIGNSANKALLK